jgi:type I restriction enzyme S subunit
LILVCFLILSDSFAFYICFWSFARGSLLYNYQNTRKVGSGNNQKALNKERIKNIPFPFTSKPEQLAIVSAIESRLSVCDKIEQTIDQTLALSEQLRQSILKKAFEGRLVPQDPNDEPAEKLLERIRAEKEAILEKKKQQRSPGSSKNKQAKVTKKKRGGK